MNDTDDLDRLFQAARAAAPKPSTALMDQVLADAYELQPAPVATPAPQAARQKARWRRWLSAMSGALGGSGALAGLGTAAVAGLFIGYADEVLVGEADGVRRVFPAT